MAYILLKGENHYNDIPIKIFQVLFKGMRKCFNNNVVKFLVIF